MSLSVCLYKVIYFYNALYIKRLYYDVYILMMYIILGGKGSILHSNFCTEFYPLVLNLISYIFLNLPYVTGRYSVDTQQHVLEELRDLRCACKILPGGRRQGSVAIVAITILVSIVYCYF